MLCLLKTSERKDGIIVNIINDGFNQEYILDSALKKKRKGRSRDIHVSDMNIYIEMKKQIEKNTENLKRANRKFTELKNN